MSSILLSSNLVPSNLVASNLMSSNVVSSNLVSSNLMSSNFVSSKLLSSNLVSYPFMHVECIICLNVIEGYHFLSVLHADVTCTVQIHAHVSEKTAYVFYVILVNWWHNMYGVNHAHFLGSLLNYFQWNSLKTLLLFALLHNKIFFCRFSIILYTLLSQHI